MRKLQNPIRSQVLLRQGLIGLSLFLAALLPRMIALTQFVTADEAKWVYRSAQFWLALLQGDWAGTNVNPTPAVTTTWTGGLGLGFYNLTHDRLPLAEFLAVIPEWTVDPAILAAARLPTIILSSLTIVLIYGLIRPSLGQRPAFLAALLLAFDPLFLAHSRFLHHDALVTIFVIPSLLLAIQTAREDKPNKLALSTSGILAGLAFLTKSPAFFLVPFVLGLFIVQAWRNTPVSRISVLHQAGGRFIIWGGLSYLTFIIGWPAAWIDPIGASLTVIFNGFQASVPDAETVGYFIDLGFFYYPVYFLFYISPVILIGLGLWLVYDKKKRLSPEARYLCQTLLLFALTFTIAMSFSDKRSVRYILPAFLPATIGAAMGWLIWLEARRRAAYWSGLVLIILLQGGLSLWHAPYYLTYLNPLMGGPWTAPHLIKLGWGEGMDQVGDWLNTRADAPANRVGASYATTLSPYFAGQVSALESQGLDYWVDYIKQRQGRPPVLDRYFESRQPLHTVHLAGIDYARIYPGPGLQLPAQSLETDSGLVAYRFGQNFAPIGQSLSLTLIGDHPLDLSDRVVLIPVDSEQNPTPLDLVRRANKDQGRILDLTLTIPADLSPGPYVLYLGEMPLGPLEARYAQMPARFEAFPVEFGGEIALLGFDPALERRMTNQGETVEINLAWQATPKAWADYTIFIHLIDFAGDRLSGYDTQPPRPTSQWLKGEVVLAHYPLSLPPELPPGRYQIRLGLYRAGNGQPLGEAVVLPVTLDNSE